MRKGSNDTLEFRIRASDEMYTSPEHVQSCDQSMWRLQLDHNQYLQSLVIIFPVKKRKASQRSTPISTQTSRHIYLDTRRQPAHVITAIPKVLSVSFTTPTDQDLYDAHHATLSSGHVVSSTRRSCRLQDRGLLWTLWILCQRTMNEVSGDLLGYVIPLSTTGSISSTALRTQRLRSQPSWRRELICSKTAAVI
jgi:hypothetical protein